MKTIDKIILIAVLFCASAILTVGLDKPFTGHHDFNNRFFSQVGERYLHYGVVALKFGQLIDGTPNSHPAFYTHHPILLPLSLAAILKILGYHNWSIRLLPVLFSLGTLAWFYLLLRRHFPPLTSVLATGFWLLTPMFAYFGKMADHEALTLFFIVGAVWFFDRKNYSWSLLLLFLGQLTGWPAYFLGAILFILSRRISFLLITIANFVLFLFHILLLTGTPLGGGLLDILLFRMGLKQLNWLQEYYTPREFVTQELQWLYHFFTPIQSLLVMFSLPKIFRDKIFFIFGSVALLHILVFRTGAWHHDYWLYYFLPFFSWGVALTINRWRSLYLLFWLLLLLAFFQGQPFFWALQTMVEK